MKVSRRRTSGLLATIAAAAAITTPNHADASLIVDVRAIGGSAEVSLTDAKHVVVNAPGDVVNFAVFARLSGTDGVTTDEQLQIAGGSFSSSFGGLLGNLSALTTAPFNGNGSSNGVQFDFDSDGDLDVGKGGTASTGTGWFGVRSAIGGIGVTPLNANTGEVQIGTLAFTYTSGTLSTLVNFIPRPGTAPGIALWTEDGVQQTPLTDVFAADGPVTVTFFVPEPTAIGLLSLASVGLLARRRNVRPNANG